MTLLTLLILAYRPILDPLPIDRYWMWLVLPLVIVTSIVYKAIKKPDLRDLPREATVLTLQILVFMVLAAAALWLITDLA